MDESAITFWQDTPRGFVVVPLGVSKLQFLERERRATLSQKRSSCSLMAFLSDDPEVQSLLPQIVFVNSHTVSAAEAAENPSQAVLEHDLLFEKRQECLGEHARDD